MMQKNFAVFIVACLAIIMGWLWLHNQLWPPRRPDQQQAGKTDPAKKVDEKKKDDKKDDDKKEAQPPVVAEVKLPEKKKDDKPAGKPPSKVEPEPEMITLGDDKTHHLQVKLTTRGAGVQQVILNRFKAANYLGEPVDRPLELVQEDPFLPSYLLYHYADATTDQPLPRLGEVNWKLESREKLAGDVAEVKFSIRVPGQEDVKVTKTYRLGPRDYHVGLVLEFERDTPSADAKAGDVQQHKFKYQLTGAHGLHLLGGVLALIYVALRGWQFYGRSQSTAAEVTGVYWHFMDGLWVFLILIMQLS